MNTCMDIQYGTYQINNVFIWQYMFCLLYNNTIFLYIMDINYGKSGHKDKGSLSLLICFVYVAGWALATTLPMAHPPPTHQWSDWLHYLSSKLSARSWYFFYLVFVLLFAKCAEFYNTAKRTTQQTRCRSITVFVVNGREAHWYVFDIDNHNVNVATTFCSVRSRWIP